MRGIVGQLSASSFGQFTFIAPNCFSFPLTPIAVCSVQCTLTATFSFFSLLFSSLSFFSLLYRLARSFANAAASLFLSLLLSIHFLMLPLLVLALLEECSAHCVIPSLLSHLPASSSSCSCSLPQLASNHLQGLRIKVLL